MPFYAVRRNCGPPRGKMWEAACADCEQLHAASTKTCRRYRE